MPNFGSCNVFLRATFGIDPGAEIGRQLSELATQVHVIRGQEVKTDPADTTLVFLASGATKLGALASRERHQIVAFHFGGDIFTVPAASMHRYMLIGLCESTLTTFPAREFYDRAASNPWIMRALLERSQTALFRCRDKAVNLGQKTAGERVAGFLLAMWERLDASEGPSPMIDLPMSRGDIGESLGLKIETVSRQFTKLRETGIIDTHGRSGVSLLDLPRLAEQAGYCDRNTVPRRPEWVERKPELVP